MRTIWARPPRLDSARTKESSGYRQQVSPISSDKMHMALVPSPSPQPRKPLTPEELSEYLSVPTRTLERWRSQRTGPLFIRMGVHVRYRPEDVDQWISNLLDEANDWFKS
jgi:excisionase family DNA binding protein